jgi:hypothetical protein
VVGDRGCGVAAVQVAGALVAQAFEQVRQFGQTDGVAGFQQAAGGRVDRHALGLVGQDRAEDLEQKSLHLGDFQAVAGGLRRRACEVGEGHAAEAVDRLGHAGRSAIDAARRWADIEPLDRLLGEADVDRLELGVPALGQPLAGRGDEEVEQVVLAPGRVDQHEPAGARPRERRLRGEAHQHGGSGGIDRIATFAQHVGPGPGRKRMTSGNDTSHGGEPTRLERLRRHERNARQPQNPRTGRGCWQ